MTKITHLHLLQTNAKLGDQLGINFWIAKSKYGATIQNALDFVMAQNPKDEDVSDIFSHVAAVAAAYGDSSGKYQKFLQNKFSGYKSAPSWFYDQTEALPNSPAAGNRKKREILMEPTEFATKEVSTSEGRVPNQSVKFDCLLPDGKTELEDGLFVTCEELRPFFEYLPSTDISYLL